MFFFYYIESPYQLNCALRHYQCLEQTADKQRARMLIRDNRNPVQLNQIERILSSAPEKPTHLDIAVCPAKGTLLRAVTMPLLVLRCLYQLLHSEAFVFGDMRSPVFRAIDFLVSGRRKKGRLSYYSLDDGMYLYPFLKTRTGIQKYLDINYITNLPLKSLGPFKVLSLPLGKRSIAETERPAIAVFIGSKLVEAKVCEYTDYIKAITQVHGLIKQGGDSSRILYVAHRGESEEHLRAYEHLGYSIVRLDLPLEEHEGRHGPLGRHYYSFYSTALFNLAALDAEGVSFSSFRPWEGFWKRNVEQISWVYDLFRDSKRIQIIDVSSV